MTEETRGFRGPAVKKAVHQDMYLENCILIMKDQDIKPPAKAKKAEAETKRSKRSKEPAHHHDATWW